MSGSTPKFAGGYTSSCYPVHYDLLGSTPSLVKEYTITVRHVFLAFAGIFACADFAAPSMLAEEYTILQLLVKRAIETPEIGWRGRKAQYIVGIAYLR